MIKQPGQCKSQNGSPQSTVKVSVEEGKMQVY